MSRVLLVSHDSSRTGAPRVAVLVARLLAADGHRVRVITREPGPLDEAFAQAAPVRAEPWWRLRRRFWSLSGSAGRLLASTIDQVLATFTIAVSRCDLVYVNSTAAAAYVRPARLLRRGLVLHVHESGAVTDRFP